MFRADVLLCPTFFPAWLLGELCSPTDRSEARLLGYHWNNHGSQPAPSSTFYSISCLDFYLESSALIDSPLIDSNLLTD